MNGTGRHGFTLIELSLVLVIMGLIVGGVLAGRDLVESAKLRSTISQIDQHAVAVTTFALKYGCLPGDCRLASTFGFSQNGNGDGRIGLSDDFVCGTGSLPGCGMPSPPNGAYVEAGQMWVHLSQANLLKTQVANEVDGLGYPLLGRATPTTPTGGAWWVVHSSVLFTQQNGGYLPDAVLSSSHVQWLTGTIQHDVVGAAVLSVVNAASIDTKVDDGLPLSGSVMAVGNQTADAWGPSHLDIGGPAGEAYCINEDVTPNAYNSAISSVAGDCDTDAHCHRCSLLLRGTF